MDRMHSAVAELQRDLDELGAKWALIGGLAVSVQAEPRTTRDIDVSVAVDSDKDAERLVNDLRSRGYRLRESGVIEQEAIDRIATVRLDTPSSGGDTGVVVDLMFASSGIEPEIVEAAEAIEALPGLTVNVARRGHLIALKVLAGRLQDLADLDSLLRFAEPADLALAESAVRLIQERGTHRAKNLLAELRAFTEVEPQ